LESGQPQALAKFEYNEQRVNKEGVLAMATRYGERDYDRGRRNYGGRSEFDYDRSYGERSPGRYGYGRDENERYAAESRWRGQYGVSPWGSGREYRSGRERSGPRSENDLDYTDERESRYGNFHRGYDTGEYDDLSSGYSQRYNYPTGFRSGERYGERGRGYDYERGDYRYGQERGWWDRASDEVASWFGDEEAERRRRMDEQRQRYRGKGPKGYRRSDERIREDINDRLSEGYLDASDIEVAVQNSEVTLTGTVNSRSDKRRAEDIAEYVTGVTNVENRLRVKQSYLDQYNRMETTGTETTGTTSSAAGGTTGAARSRTAGT
jgi:osmotically-inducible protein OsmY